MYGQKNVEREVLCGGWGVGGGGGVGVEERGQAADGMQGKIGQGDVGLL